MLKSAFQPTLWRTVMPMWHQPFQHLWHIVSGLYSLIHFSTSQGDADAQNKITIVIIPEAQTLCWRRGQRKKSVRRQRQIEEKKKKERRQSICVCGAVIVRLWEKREWARRRGGFWEKKGISSMSTTCLWLIYSSSAVGTASVSLCTCVSDTESLKVGQGEKRREEREEKRGGEREEKRRGETY